MPSYSSCDYSKVEFPRAKPLYAITKATDSTPVQQYAILAGPLLGDN